MMQSLQEAIGRELLWRPRSLRSRTSDLVDPRSEGGEPYATLLWRPGWLMGGPAEASTADGAWTFRHRGLLWGTVLVSAEGREGPLAMLRQYWRRAALRFEDGRQFVWRHESPWSRWWRFEDANGTPIVRVRRRLWSASGACLVEIEASAPAAGDRALLVCLAWYLTLLARRRAVHAGGAG